ncbi:MAG: PT domain-containing protein [Clostridia bacterium]|nr:PT domain-containing protein [Clostridia bacterium]
MRYKKTAALMLAFALLGANACAPVKNPENTPAPTAELTATPTQRPTEAPTAVPTEAPTDEPTAAPCVRPTAPPDTGEMPSFPGAIKTGNLIGGPLFDEPAKYFMIPGESDMHYVYDRFGELVAILNRERHEDSGASWGFYGEHGAPFGCGIESGEELPLGWLFGDMSLNISWHEWHDDDGQRHSCFFLDGISDYRYENEISMNDAPEHTVRSYNEDNENAVETIRAYKLGWAGSVLHIDGKYLILERETWYNDEKDMFDVRTKGATLLDESGAMIGHPDFSVFGEIRGVFGGKYIIGEQPIYEEEWTEDEYGNIGKTVMNLYTLSGELVANRVLPHKYDGFALDSEDYYGYVMLANYCSDENGQCFDKELNPIDKPTDLQIRSERPGSIYSPIELENRRLEIGSVYVGIKDDAGNWLFRIYNPNFASDSQRKNRW